MYILRFFFQSNEFELLQTERKRRLQRRNSMHGCDKQKSCLMCVMNIPVFSPEELEIGDHLVFKRGFYDHHGITTGKRNRTGQNNLFEFEITEPTNSSSESMAALGTSKILGEKAVINRSWKIIDFDKGNVGKVVYRKRFPKNLTASLAIFIHKVYKNNPKSYKYHLLTNNCEHFATFCVTGEMFSLQVARHASYVQHLFPILDSRFNLELEVKRQCMQYMFCIPCFKIVNIESKKDVKKGDIIVYFDQDRYNWHYGVVLWTKKPTNTSVKCSVAHNTSCAQHSRKGIEAIHLEIKFMKSFYKLDFTSSNVEVYDSEVVVKRALKMMGEQMLEYFTNQCSNFPIWCKHTFESRTKVPSIF